MIRGGFIDFFFKIGGIRVFFFVMMLILCVCYYSVRIRIGVIYIIFFIFCCDWYFSVLVREEWEKLKEIEYICMILYKKRKMYLGIL